MGLDIYFKKVRGGQSANDALAEKQNKRNEEFKELLATAESKNLDEVKAQLQHFMWYWEWPSVSKANTLDEVMRIVREIYKEGEEDHWGLLDYEGERVRRDRFYFRKVNCIYGYCADNELIEDGEVAMLDHEHMLDILKRAKEILSQPTEEKKLAKGKELLPTQGGFFFGSTDYDKWYIEDIAEVAKKFEDMIAEWDDAYAVVFSW